MRAVHALPAAARVLLGDRQLAVQLGERRQCVRQLDQAGAARDRLTARSSSARTSVGRRSWSTAAPVRSGRAADPILLQPFVRTTSNEASGLAVHSQPVPAIGGDEGEPSEREHRDDEVLRAAAELDRRLEQRPASSLASNDRAEVPRRQAASQCQIKLPSRGASLPVLGSACACRRAVAMPRRERRLTPPPLYVVAGLFLAPAWPRRPTDLATLTDCSGGPRLDPSPKRPSPGI